MFKRRATKYAELLEEAVTRQPEHEREHLALHPHASFTQALRIEAVANRLERKIAAAGLPPLPANERRKRAAEALWRSRT